MCKHSEGGIRKGLKLRRTPSGNAVRTKRWHHERQYSEIPLDYFFYDWWTGQKYSLSKQQWKLQSTYWWSRSKAWRLLLTFPYLPVCRTGTFDRLNFSPSTPYPTQDKPNLCFLNEPFVQGGCVPVLFFPVASGTVNFFSAVLSLHWPRSLHRVSKRSRFMYDTALKPKDHLLGYFDILWIPLIFAQCCK